MTALPGAGGITAAWKMRVATGRRARIGARPRSPARTHRTRSDAPRSTARSRPMPSPMCSIEAVSRRPAVRRPATCAARRSARSAFFTESFIDELARARRDRAAGLPDGDARRQSAPRALPPGAPRGSAAWDGGGARQHAWASPAARRSARTSGWSPMRPSATTRRSRSTGWSPRSIAGAIVNSGLVAQQIEGGLIWALGAGHGRDARMGGRNAARAAARRDRPAAHRPTPGDPGASRSRAASRRAESAASARPCSRPRSPTPSSPAPASGCATCRSTLWRRHEQTADHPEVTAAAHRRAADQPRHARRARSGGGAALPRRIPQRPAGGRDSRHRVEADPARDHPAHAARRNRPRPISQVWTDEGSPLRRSRSGRRQALRERLGRQSSRRLCDALRQPGHCGSDRAHGRRRLRRGSSPRRSIRNIARRRRRPRTTRFSPRSRAMRVPAGAAHAAALLRRSALHRRAAREPRAAARRRSTSSRSGCC